MIRVTVTAAALAAAGPACAQEITLKPRAEARLRYEQVDQDDFADRSGALTARVRSGVSATSGGWSALVEAQGTLAIAGDHYDGLDGATARPLIGDPQNVALYLAQLQYRSPAITLTAGRQRIMLDDERFVGAADFRQNGQTFDAVRAEWTPLKGLKADVSYAWSVRTIWGIDGHDARQRAVSGGNVFANLSYATPLGTLTGFAYLVDQDEAAVQGFRLSSQTYGARLAGSRPLATEVKLSWQASYATQADYHRNPNDYRADYYLVDAALGVGGWKLGGGYEVLGADGGAALTAFQAPLGSVFKFQGWADKFVTTPPDGVRDLYANVGRGWKAVGPFTAVSLQAVYHHFDSDRLVRHYGDEIDLLASGKLGKTTLSVRYADYQAKRFATDTSKLWLQLDWAL
ncbi:alginate export family protein [Sphingomonas sp. DT-204]|uniref:alginate export family protein n=1 Tax=Sphingomonas sp. DT-204 TaxID=3396166 RepID=UPI003F1D2708